MSTQGAAPQLRPLGIGEILDVGIKIYTRNALTLFKIVVFVVLPAQILVNIAEVSALPSDATISNGGVGGVGPFGGPITTEGTLTGHQVTVLLVGFISAFLIQFIAARFRLSRATTRAPANLALASRVFSSISPAVALINSSASCTTTRISRTSLSPLPCIIVL